MKAIFYVSALIIVLITAGGCSSGEGFFRTNYDFGTVDKIAVIDVTGDIAGEAAKNQIADFFVMELLKKGYAPVERAQVQSLLKEHKFQSSEITSTEDAVQAGKILNVKIVLIVNIPNFDEEVSMTAKMVNVEDGSILWLGSGMAKSSKTLSTIAGATVGAVAGAAVSEGDRTIGAVAGGVLGGVAGNLLSPQEAHVAREITKKMCKNLPMRPASQRTTVCK